MILGRNPNSNKRTGTAYPHRDPSTSQSRLRRLASAAPHVSFSFLRSCNSQELHPAHDTLASPSVDSGTSEFRLLSASAESTAAVCRIRSGFLLTGSARLARTDQSTPPVQAWLGSKYLVVDTTEYLENNRRLAGRRVYKSWGLHSMLETKVKYLSFQV